MCLFAGNRILHEFHVPLTCGSGLWGLIEGKNSFQRTFEPQWYEMSGTHRSEIAEVLAGHLIRKSSHAVTINMTIGSFAYKGILDEPSLGVGSLQFETSSASWESSKKRAQSIQ
jgi:hypothetical protein